MPLYVLDTDHVTLIQRGHPRVIERLTATTSDSIAASIISYEEQLRGRLAVIRQSDTSSRRVTAYQRLREMQEFF